MLAYNNKVSRSKKQLKATNMGIVKCSCRRVSIELNSNLINNT